MESTFTLKQLLATSATISTVLQFLTGSVICHKYIRKKSTGESSSFPFVSGFLSCFMWLKYGILTAESTLILVNFIGSTLFFSYTVIFFIITVSKRIVVRQVMLVSIVILSATIYTVFETDTANAVRVIGLLCCCLGVLFFASPLTTLAHVVRTRNTDSLPFPIIIASFFVSLQWTIYGVLISDHFIQIPNFLGCLLSSVQLMLYVIYPKANVAIATGAGGPQYTPLLSDGSANMA